MNTFTFNNRETYLIFRAAWKKEYNELSQEIRNLKVTWTAEIKSGGGSTIYALIRKRREATAMMLLLEEAKLEAASQWAAARQGEAA